MPAINLDRVTDRLKSVKTDSVRQNDPEGMDRSLEPDRGKKLVGRADEEIQIFENAKCSEIGGKTNEQEASAAHGFRGILDFEADHVVQAGRAEEDEGKPPARGQLR